MPRPCVSTPFGSTRSCRMFVPNACSRRSCSRRWSSFSVMRVCSRRPRGSAPRGRGAARARGHEPPPSRGSTRASAIARSADRRSSRHLTPLPHGPARCSHCSPRCSSRITHADPLVLPALQSSPRCSAPALTWHRIAPGFRRPTLGTRGWMSLAARHPRTAAARYLPLAAMRDPVPGWGDPRTPAAFLHLLLRADYGTFR